MGLKIGFTYDLKEDHRLKTDQPQDALAELDAIETIDEVVSAFSSGGHEVVRIGHAKNLLKRINDLNVDIVFNLCEGVGHRNRESEVPAILDLFRIPFVGSDALTLGLTLDKVVAKKVFIADGIPTPKYLVANTETDLLKLDGMKFPLIVKPRYEGSSKGISDASIVLDEKMLRSQVHEIVSTYHQAALVEEFIYGSEFTVLVIGNQAPEALPPVQIKIAGRLECGDLVYTSRRLEGTDIEYICPPKTDAKLVKELCDISVAAYQSAECRDFSRVDFRVDKNGTPYVLEINPLPSLSKDDVFPLIAQAMGISYDQLVLKVLDAALERYGMDEK